MRVDRHSVERKNELERFCVRVQEDRAKNDESAEYNRTNDLECNPNSSAYGSAAHDLAAITDGGDFDRSKY